MERLRVEAAKDQAEARLRDAEQAAREQISQLQDRLESQAQDSAAELETERVRLSYVAQLQLSETLRSTGEEKAGLQAELERRAVALLEAESREGARAAEATELRLKLEVQEGELKAEAARSRVAIAQLEERLQEDGQVCSNQTTCDCPRCHPQMFFQRSQRHVEHVSIHLLICPSGHPTFSIPRGMRSMSLFIS